MTARSARIDRTLEAMSPFLGFFANSTWARRRDELGASDFVFGNPHEMPMPGLVSALRDSLEPQNRLWFGYKTNEPESRRVLARSLRERRNVPYEEEDIFVTNGAFAALAVATAALVDPGDDVIFISPPWFFYEAILVTYGAKAVRVGIDPHTFDLDVGAIADAITPRTRAILVNSPNNPTGKIYPPETLRALADVLLNASQAAGRPVFLLSDEAYSRIVFDGRSYPSPTEFYPNALLLYTYGKTLLAPGQRVGYIALPPGNPHRKELRDALFAAQLVTGFAFPNALLQHALGDLETLSIDIAHLQRKRDRMVAALRDMGYELQVPEGTFYLLVRSPLDDDLAFCELLAQHDVFVLPGTVVELPGTFRISLTASDEMIERALPIFETAYNDATASSNQPAAARDA